MGRHSHFLPPQISFWALAEIRIAQSVGIAMLFVPINAAAFLTIRKEDTGDASALFVMFRNVAGSIGISLSTAMVTERTQVRMAHLGSNLTPFDQGYVDLLAHYTEPLVQLCDERLHHRHQPGPALQGARRRLGSRVSPREGHDRPQRTIRLRRRTTAVGAVVTCVEIG